jgi:hypothetical protein
MFAGCLQIMRAHLHLIRAEGIGYSQIIRAENPDVCRSCDLCLQAATGSGSSEEIETSVKIDVTSYYTDAQTVS